MFEICLPRRIFDFISLTPEAMHMITWLFSPWGIPANYREMRGSGHVVRQKLARQNNYGQAGDRYRAMEAWERDELISNLAGALSLCDEGIQQRMVSHLTQCDEEYGRHVAEGLGVESKPLAETAEAR